MQETRWGGDAHSAMHCAPNEFSGGVSPEQAANLLDTALTSGDETVILGALGALTSVPVAA